MNEGRKEGRKDRWMDGRNEGMKKLRKEWTNINKIYKSKEGKGEGKAEEGEERVVRPYESDWVRANEGKQ